MSRYFQSKYAIKAAGAKGKRIILDKYGSEENAAKALASQGMAFLLEKLPGSGALNIIQTIAGILGVTTDAKVEESVFAAMSETVNSPGAENPLVKIAADGAINLLKSNYPEVSQDLPAIVANISKLPIPKGVPPHPAAIAAAVAITVATKIAYANCIARPYEDLLRNTETLREAVMEIERVTVKMRDGSRLFSGFLENDAMMEESLKSSMDRTDQAGRDALDAILKI